MDSQNDPINFSVDRRCRNSERFFSGPDLPSHGILRWRQPQPDDRGLRPGQHGQRAGKCIQTVEEDASPFRQIHDCAEKVYKRLQDIECRPNLFRGTLSYPECEPLPRQTVEKLHFLKM